MISCGFIIDQQFGALVRNSGEALPQKAAGFFVGAKGLT
jgi:hypothetical protein